MYADDTVSICRSTQEVSKSIKVFQQWAEDNFMKVNKSKCAIVHMSKRKSRKV